MIWGVRHSFFELARGWPKANSTVCLLIHQHQHQHHNKLFLFWLGWEREIVNESLYGSSGLE